MTSVVSLHAFANSPNPPLVVRVDKQQEHLAKPRLLAIFEIGAALNNCRKVLDYSRRTGLSSRSCYCCQPFAALVNQSRGGIVLARFAGEADCLSTLIDAFHRNHKVTFLCDASASHALEEMSADEVRHAVSTISGVYAEVYKTAEWIAATAPRKLSNGKGGGG